jgi:MFS family permease
VPHLTVTHTVDRPGAERLLAPRHDIVEERLDTGTDTDIPESGPGEGEAGETATRLVLAHGPFEHYRRTVRVAPAGIGDDGEARLAVSETFDYQLPPGTWHFLMNRAVRASLRRPPAAGKLPWWYPPQRPDARSATVLGLLATLSLIVGYHGTLLTQTMTFAADEFGAGTGAQGAALAAVRLGGVLAIGLGMMADRRGRRLILTLSLLASIGSTALGALAPNLATFAVTQAVNRGSWAATTLLLAIIASEEMPAGARAYALSLLSMTGGLGAGMALWLLPVAETGTRSWRLLYLVPLLFVPIVVRFGRLIPESRRFVRPHRNVAMAGHYGRLLLVASAAFLLNVFMAPQSQFRNEFLREERGMTAAGIAAFVLVTSTPAGIGILAGGRLADTRGRRVVGATGITVGTALITLSFVAEGVAMWAFALVGAIFAAALVPTITVYGPELFPTSLRGRANGIVSTTAMGGSMLGLLAAGMLEEAAGSFGRALALLAVAPLLMAVVVVVLFPETARRELEDLNPEDRSGEGRPDARPPAAVHGGEIGPTGRDDPGPDGLETLTSG